MRWPDAGCCPACKCRRDLVLRMILWGAAAALLAVSVSVLLAENGYAQVDLGEGGGMDTTMCWEKAENGSLNVLRDCGFKDDYLVAAVAPWVWVTGGYFGMILVSVFVLITYIKYRNWVYPGMVGSMYLPVSFYMFPEHFVGTAILFLFVGIGVAVWLTMVRQTKEND